MRRLIPFALATLLVAAGTWNVLERSTTDNSPTAEHLAPIPETPRTVVVSSTMPQPSAHERRLSAMLEAGSMPHGPTMGQVVTDMECAPDAEMISRCRNDVRLADGSTMVLRHPHDMRMIPCLAPGEQVLLVPASA